MSLLNTVSALCRAPGGYAAQMMSLLQKFRYSGQMPGTTVLLFFLLAVAMVMLLPMTFYWQYRGRRWWQLAAGAVAFICMQDYLMLQDKAGMGQSFFGATVLFSLLYLPLIVWWQGSRYLVGRLAGTHIARLPLAWHEWLVLLALAPLAHLILFVALNVLDLLSSDVLQTGGNIINCLLYFSQPLKVEAYRDVLNMLLATLPMLTLVSLLAACFVTRRRP